MDSGPKVIAPYGTKVGALSRSEPICLDLTQSDDGGLVSTSSTAAGACDSDHDTWWSQIRAGSLVDAKDLQGVWYQVKQLIAVYPVHVHLLTLLYQKYEFLFDNDLLLGMELIGLCDGYQDC